MNFNTKNLCLSKTFGFNNLGSYTNNFRDAAVKKVNFDMGHPVGQTCANLLKPFYYINPLTVLFSRKFVNNFTNSL